MPESVEGTNPIYTSTMHVPQNYILYHLKKDLENLVGVRDMRMSLVEPLRFLSRAAVANVCYVPYLQAQFKGKKIDQVRMDRSKIYMDVLIKEQNVLVLDRSEEFNDEEKWVPISDAYGLVTSHWEQCCNPNGEEIVNCIQDACYAAFVAEELRPNSSEVLTKFYTRMLAALGIKYQSEVGFRELAVRVAKPGTPEYDSMRRVTKNGPLSEHRARDTIKATMVTFQLEVRKLCTANFNSTMRPSVSSLLKTAKAFEGTLTTIFGKRGNARPWVYFFATNPFPEAEEVDTKPFKTYSKFNTITAILGSKNRTQLNQVLNDPELKRIFKTAGRLIFCLDIYHRKGSNKGISAGDQLQSSILRVGTKDMETPEFILGGWEITKSIPRIPRILCDVFLLMYKVLASQDLDLPKLESRPEEFSVETGLGRRDDSGPNADALFSSMFGAHEVEPGTFTRAPQAGEPESIMKGRRQKKSEPTESDSGMIIPILLVGAVIYMMS